MTLGKNCKPKLKREALEEGFEFLDRIREIRRKRIMVSDNLEASSFISPLKTQLKNQKNENSIAVKSYLESLPQDILTRVMCCVDHDDLKQLFHVSKLIREAALIAKQVHFAYSTPSKAAALRPFSDLEDGSKFDDDDVPNAPKHQRNYRSRICRKKLADISVALFHSPEKDQCRKPVLFKTKI